MKLVIGDPRMRLGIVGSRGFTDYASFRTGLDELKRRCLLPPFKEIVTGGARGVDALARRYGEEKGIPVREYRPDYKRYGKAAPLVRNREVVENCDEVYAFWDGQSKGTEYTVKYARERGKFAYVVGV